MRFALHFEDTSMFKWHILWINVFDMCQSIGQWKVTSNKQKKTKKQIAQKMPPPQNSHHPVWIQLCWLHVKITSSTIQRCYPGDEKARLQGNKFVFSMWTVLIQSQNNFKLDLAEHISLFFFNQTPCSEFVPLNIWWHSGCQMICISAFCNSAILMLWYYSLVKEGEWIIRPSPSRTPGLCWD